MQNTVCKWRTHSNDNTVINLSSKELDQKTSSALGYGLSFSYNNKPVNPVDITRGLINLQRKSNISESTVSVCKGFLYGSMVQQRDVSCFRRFVKTDEELKKDDSIHTAPKRIRQRV